MPIHSAAYYTDDRAVVSTLLRGGAGANLTSAHIAVLNGDRGTLATALEGGADPNGADGYGWTPLHFAALMARIISEPVLVAELVAAGADPDARDLAGMTPWTTRRCTTAAWRLSRPCWPAESIRGPRVPGGTTMATVPAGPWPVTGFSGSVSPGPSIDSSILTRSPPARGPCVAASRGRGTRPSSGGDPLRTLRLWLFSHKT